jgi:hypothetical protein
MQIPLVLVRAIVASTGPVVVHTLDSWNLAAWHCTTLQYEWSFILVTHTSF